MRSLAAAPLFVCALAGCASPAPAGDASLDATSLDATSLDATSPDATTLDATSPPDASGLDARDATPGDDVRVAADVSPDSSTPARGLFAYLGLGNGDIAAYSMDPASAVLTPRGAFAVGGNPSFLAVDPSARHLYAVNEPSSEVVALAIDPTSGALRVQNRRATGGAGPAFVSVDRAGRNVLVANYGGGSVSVFPLAADGSLGAASDRETPGSNCHAILTSLDDRFAFVPSLGSNTVSQFVFDGAAGTLTPNTPPSVATAAGAGPRHLAFHPGGRFVYVINELNDTMTAYALAPAGTLAPIQTLSTLPVGVDGASNSCADVHVAPSGRFLYGSNRGHDSLVIFAIDAATGRLTLVGHTPTGGRTPRNFTLDPTGAFLFAANQASNSVVTFRVDPTLGTLTRIGTIVTAAAPYYVGVVALPAP